MIYVKGYTPLRAIALPLLFLASSGLHAQGAPRFVVSADTVLIDEPIRLSLHGVQPRQDVLIQLDGNHGLWHSSETFRSDEHGDVAIADPMKLIWSATGDPRQGAPGAMGALQPWVFSATANGQVVAADTVWRRAVGANVRVTPVRESGLVGTAYFPPGPGPHPALLVLGGSLGGIPGPAAHAGGLASRGYVVLALGYFNAEGLPPKLSNIPLEYFGTAIDWLRSQPTVDTARIGVLGTSRGGELALLLGSVFPSLHAVVANVPSNVVWPGLSDDGATPAWTWKGKPFTAVPARFTPGDSIYQSRERFLRSMHDANALARAEIPVERINGPVLLFSSKDDQLWPSDIFAARAVARLQANQFKHAVEHYSYENAGHGITRPYVSTMNVREVRVHPVSHRKIMAGGTPEGQARANEDSWQRLLTFLDKYLRQ